MNYDETNRGEIQKRERAKQLINFSGMKFGKITPTDIDGFIDFHNLGFVFLEYKLTDAEMPTGQRLSYERLADVIEKGGGDPVVFQCSHEHFNPEEDIDGANAKVVRMYYKGKWIDGCTGTVRENAESFFHYLEND